MPPKPTVLILGSGPRIGSSIAQHFLTLSYNVAVASRTGTTPSPSILGLTADFTNPSSIPPLFAAVKQKFGTPPNIVVYNAAALTAPPNPESALSIPVESVQSDLSVNVVSPYVAAQEAVKGWGEAETAGASAEQGVTKKKAFIYTGNALNTMILPVPMFLNLGVGKAGSAYWIGAADELYKGKGYRFFFADERYAHGEPKNTEIDGPAHAEFYEELANGGEGVPWHATFVKGKGYVAFK
ncbi:hypothetical protein NX059_005336 [Plenodomus lindquistii]|nr:hypothetical protein NX059_005336 [Plenodomus lindquistii]